MINQSIDVFKQKQLRKHKATATGLFVLMVGLYIFSTWLLKTKENTWLGYVNAFSEAAMVGALADWFAVTALFHHPLGIPIPHTNLIENRKKSIGDNLGGFVVSNFLNASTIRPYITKLNISHLITEWLSREKNREQLVSEASRLLKDVVTRADDQAVTRFIASRSIELLKNIRLNEVLGAGLDIIMERGDHVRILNYIVEKLRTYVIANEEMIRERVKKESHFLIPGFVDNIIAAKITSGLAKYLSEIEADAHHKIRNDVNKQLVQFIQDVKTNPKWQKELQGIKDNILHQDRIYSYAASAWKHIQAGMIHDLESESPAIEQYLKKTLTEWVTNLKQDTNMQQKLNSWVQYNGYKYLLKNTRKAGELISTTVGNWEGKELSNKLELEVGKDLQFIRINGTLVGGLVGLLIYTITHFIQRG